MFIKQIHSFIFKDICKLLTMGKDDLSPTSSVTSLSPFLLCNMPYWSFFNCITLKMKGLHLPYFRVKS